MKLAALTAQHNMNLTRIGVLELEKMSLFEREAKDKESFGNLNEIMRKVELGIYGNLKLTRRKKWILLILKLSD